MWRLTIIQVRKEMYLDGKEFDVTNEITLEANCKRDILGIIDVMEELKTDNVSYKIEKVVE